jgi:hypothetical protein
MKRMKRMKGHEGAQGWEPGFTGLREQRKGVNEHTALFITGAFVYAFPLFVPAAGGGAQP